MSARVSILIPCYNAAPWLASTLESALAQTWHDCEIICVDDGSTDTSLAIARTYEARGVRVFTQPNSGAAAARNYALKIAQGDFIQFLDADDLLAPDKISIQLARLEASSPRSLAAGPWGRFSTDTSSAVFVPEDNWRNLPAVDWLCLNFAGRGMMPPAAWLFSRELAIAAGPWDESLSLNDDGEYFCRILLCSSGVVFTPQARSFYRSGLPGSLSGTRSRRAWNSAYRSQLACSRNLLAVEDSIRTRRACADLFIRLAYAIYPDFPDLVTACELESASHGGSRLRIGGGRALRLSTRLLGWKTARRLQNLLRRRLP